MTYVSTFRHYGPATLNYGLFGGCIGKPYGSTAVWPERRVADDSSDARLSALMTSAQAGDRAAYCGRNPFGIVTNSTTVATSASNVHARTGAGRAITRTRLLK